MVEVDDLAQLPYGYHAARAIEHLPERLLYHHVRR